MKDIKEFLESYVNIVRLARKPDKEEFWMVAKITGAGMLIIGAIGFLMFLTMDVFPSYLVG